MANQQSVEQRTVAIPADVRLQADLCVPASLRGVVIFAHGAGSSRHSPRNRSVAEAFNRAGLATVLLDLLTESEEVLDERTGHLRFDIELLAKRLLYAVVWIGRQSALSRVKLGCFGASTGAAAALLAASEARQIAAVVSRGGRPDLAGAALEKVHAPVLLLVGGNDPAVLELNRQALPRIPAQRQLQVIPGATHLFEEPGALDEVVRGALLWFDRWLSGRHPSRRAA